MSNFIISSAYTFAAQNGEAQALLDDISAALKQEPGVALYANQMVVTGSRAAQAVRAFVQNPTRERETAERAQARADLFHALPAPQLGISSDRSS